MYVIGTAGHVDHGKSTLIQALTGIDPDRLPQEKERGMTIDLGFAWITLPSGREVSIVDVPGHERFVSNMLAGAGGVDVAVLVVAADEGVMPQTSEHLAILDLLQVKRGIVAIAKSDLADPDLLELVSMEVEEILEATTLQGSPVIPVSAVTGQGLDTLKETIDDVLAASEPRKDVGRPRLPIDRSFTVAGFGTVVTGTLIDGSLSVGQQVELAPSRRTVRIRGLQTHKQKLETAMPGSRVAVNLSGVGHNEISRGEVLTDQGWLSPSTMVDVKLKLLADMPRPLRHNTGVVFYSFTSECEARVRLLEGPELKPGEEGWAPVHLTRPVPLVKDDFFVLRSPDTTVGGGRVMDAHPRRHKRGHAPTLERLRALEEGTLSEALSKALEAQSPLSQSQLSQQVNVSFTEVKAALEEMERDRLAVVLPGSEEPLAYSSAVWSRMLEEARRFLQAYHGEHPLRRGAPREELRSRIRLPAQIFTLVLDRVKSDGAFIEEEALIRLPEHSVSLSEAQQRQVAEYLDGLRAHPFSPPTDQSIDPELVSYLVDEGKAVKLDEAVVLSAEAFQDAVERITAHIREKGKATVAELRDLLGTSRKYIMPLLNHMDKQRVTRRMGDDRVLR